MAYVLGQIPEDEWRRAETKRLRNRIRNQRRYKPDAWLRSGIVLTLAPELEARFQDDLRPLLTQHHRAWVDVPDGSRDKLRFGWRRFMLDRPRPDAWRAKAEAAMLDLAQRYERRGAPLPELQHDDGMGSHVLRVTRRPTAYSKRTRMTGAEVGRALSAPAMVSAAIGREKAVKEAKAAKVVAKAEKAARAAARVAAGYSGRGRPRREHVPSSSPSYADPQSLLVPPRAHMEETVQQRLDRLQQLYRVCLPALQAAMEAHPGCFDLATAMGALEQRENGDPEAWLDYLAQLRRQGGAATTAGGMSAPRQTRREMILTARWAPTIE
jgi:hypothetical protein